MKLNAVRLFVTDLAAARRFYGELLGLALKVDGSGYGYCVFDAGGVELVVEGVAADAPAEDQAMVGRFSGVSFDVADVDETFRVMQGRGVVFAGEPERQFWGGVLATFVDPAGNQLQIVQRPHEVAQGGGA